MGPELIFWRGGRAARSGRGEASEGCAWATLALNLMAASCLRVWATQDARDARRSAGAQGPLLTCPTASSHLTMRSKGRSIPRMLFGRDRHESRPWAWHGEGALCRCAASPSS